MYLLSRGMNSSLGDFWVFWVFWFLGFLVSGFWFLVSGFWHFWFLLPDVLAIFIAKTPRKQVVGSTGDFFTVGWAKDVSTILRKRSDFESFFQHRDRGHFCCSPRGATGHLGGGSHPLRLSATHICFLPCLAEDDDDTVLRPPYRTTGTRCLVPRRTHVRFWRVSSASNNNVIF